MFKARVPGESAIRLCQASEPAACFRQEYQARLLGARVPGEVPGKCASLVFQASVPESSLALTAWLQYYCRHGSYASERLLLCT
ncbi:hypothetical protein J6590_088732 [Homalodisca vitripennis]|nr:hypothetical protein J6590_088732 [Homalodisca vitripennis]